MHRLLQISILVALAKCAMACASTSTTNFPEKVNRRDFMVDVQGGQYSISLFPKTYSALMGSSFSLILLSPVLVKDDALYNSGSASIIPWFNARGISVWLIRVKNDVSLEKFGQSILPEILTSVRKNSNDGDWVIGGISLGGQAVAHYLAEAPKHSASTGMTFKAAFFLGTPFDYNYPGAFGKRLANANDGERKNLCSADFCDRFFKGFHENLIVSKKDLHDQAGKPLWNDILSPTLMRGKGVRIFFLAGKIDNVAPSESLYAMFSKTIPKETENSPDARFLQPGYLNRMSRDFNHADMIAGEALCDDVLPEILKWINL